jgi:hypothetical protein
LTPEKTAESATKFASDCRASRRASVVLPVPGAPQKMSDGSAPLADELLLTDELCERARSHTLGERRVGVDGCRVVRRDRRGVRFGEHLFGLASRHVEKLLTRAASAWQHSAHAIWARESL